MTERPHRIRDPRVLTPPNVLSLFRIALLPPTLLALERQPAWGFLPVLALVGLALGTDALDGLLARRRRWISDTGRALDPLADKVYLGGVLLYLVVRREFPAWLAGLVVGRDLLLLAAAALFLRRHRVVFPANLWGKLSTVLLSLLVLAHLLEARSVAAWLVPAAAASVLVSFGAYAWSAARFVGRRAAAG